MTTPVFVVIQLGRATPFHRDISVRYRNHHIFTDPILVHSWFGHTIYPKMSLHVETTSLNYFCGKCQVDSTKWNMK